MIRLLGWFVAGVTTLLTVGCFGDVNTQSDLDSPLLEILSPQQADTVSGLVSFQVAAQDAGGIDVVKFYVDGALLTTDLRAPYQTVWNTGSASLGPHALRAEAIDLAGNASTETVVVVVATGRN